MNKSTRPHPKGTKTLAREAWLRKEALKAAALKAEVASKQAQFAKALAK